MCVSHEVAYDSGLFSIAFEGSVILNTESNLKIDYTEARFPKDINDQPSKTNFQKREEYFIR
ncbi:hypothetical protein D3C87_2171970 [compost metagenome]